MESWETEATSARRRRNVGATSAQRHAYEKSARRRSRGKECADRGVEISIRSMSKPGIIIQCTFYCASADAAACSVVVRQSLCSRVSHRLAEIRSCIQPRLRTIKRMTFHYLEDLHTPTYGSIRGREVPACIRVTQSRSFFSPSSSLFR